MLRVKRKVQKIRKCQIRVNCHLIGGESLSVRDQTVPAIFNPENDVISSPSILAQRHQTYPENRVAAASWSHIPLPEWIDEERKNRRQYERRPKTGNPVHR